MYKVTFLPAHLSVCVEEGTTLLEAQRKAGLYPDAPCGGKGSCQKCQLILEGKKVLACQTNVNQDMSVMLPWAKEEVAFIQEAPISVLTDKKHTYALTFDVGTTTIAGYILDGTTGKQLASASCINLQTTYGADVLSRIQYVLEGEKEALRKCLWTSLRELTEALSKKAGIKTEKISVTSIAGNTAMHHLLLGIDPSPLITPPYMPATTQAIELPAKGLLPVGGQIRVLPNIAGFVGGDTIGGVIATLLEQQEAWTLLLDIGTNGEMVLGNKERMIACSTAAGPAFEGAKITCGMRAVKGAIDHVTLENKEIKYHVIGEEKPIGLCGSGLLDLIAVLLEKGDLDESGYLENGRYQLKDTEVCLYQKDVREVQLAKAAIRAGIELLAQKMDISVENIQKVCLAGAFGNYLKPSSACRIGMIPSCLEARICPVGNAAGAGAMYCAINKEVFMESQRLAQKIEFLELASMPEFQDCYVDALEF